MADCVTKVELHISCRGLLDKDTTSKSDPLCSIYIQDTHGKWVEHARTEKIQNNLNPDFAKGITIDYYFEMVQKLKFSVYDVDNETSSLGDDDFLGDMECNLGQIVSKKSFAKTLQIKGRQVGTITVYAEELKGGNEIVQLTFRATNLDKKDFLGKSDPFLQLSKVKSDGGTLLVHRTEIGCYDWDQDDNNDLIGCVDVTLRDLIGTKESGIDCFDYDDDGSHDFIGSNSTTLRQLLETKQTGVRFGIDFTASNGDPNHPQSLHFLNPYEPNEYVKALVAVGEVCQDYDSDKFFPALGFGARIPPNNQVSHEFPLNFNATNPYCQGIPEIVAAYQNCIRQVQLYGPTNVSPIINHVIRFAEQAAKENAASDTKLAIIKASRLPMSVIIVGVGQADFKDMNELDADEGRLRCGHHYADRDIVQFVPFREFKTQSPALLAKHVLAEVPKQVQEYFSKRGLTPMPPKGPAPPSLGGL
ncbi:Copine-4 [Desmophyllum pertusum]|uniref:Copine-4 n=1 Tax=Desmophyllum pertusum TaxID=174260 RepID=A0A9W9YWI1_9CNID|nr:Copine-4 [Desmophyllum pertusum]